MHGKALLSWIGIMLLILVLSIGLAVHLDASERRVKALQEKTAKAVQRESQLKSQLLATLEGVRVFVQEQKRLPRSDELGLVELNIPIGQAGYIPDQGFENPYFDNSEPHEISTDFSDKNPIVGQVHLLASDAERETMVVYAIADHGKLISYSYHLPAIVKSGK